MDEIRKIIEEYKAAIEEAGSENQRRAAMEYAFNRILEVADPEKPERKKNRFSDDPFYCTVSSSNSDDVEREEKTSPAIYIRRTDNDT